MKRRAVIVAVVCLFALAQAGWAANLDSSWYVKLGLVDVRGWDGVHPWQQIVDWSFTSSLGTTGPFDVTSPDPVYARRMVSVPTTVSGIAPGTSVDLWGEPVSPVSFPITEVVPYYDTNYDASQMRLQLLMYRAEEGFTLLWEQTRSGVWGDWSNVLGTFQSVPVGHSIVFRVTAVPEPTPFVSLACAILASVSIMRRRPSR